jgi:general L-amino acid transport system substrate-binding protein
MFKHLKQLTSLFAMIAVLFAFTTEAMAKKVKNSKKHSKEGFC